MLYLSSVLIDEKDIETFDELLEVIKIRAKDGEIFIKIDLLTNTILINIFFYYFK